MPAKDPKPAKLRSALPAARVAALGNAKVGAVSKGEIIVDDELACELSAHLAEHGLADLIEVFRLLAAWKDDEMKKLGSQQ